MSKRILISYGDLLANFSSKLFLVLFSSFFFSCGFFFFFFFTLAFGVR